MESYLLNNINIYRIGKAIEVYSRSNLNALFNQAEMVMLRLHYMLVFCPICCLICCVFC